MSPPSKQIESSSQSSEDAISLLLQNVVTNAAAYDTSFLEVLHQATSDIVSTARTGTNPSQSSSSLGLCHISRTIELIDEALAIIEFEDDLGDEVSTLQ